MRRGIGMTKERQNKFRRRHLPLCRHATAARQNKLRRARTPPEPSLQHVLVLHLVHVADVAHSPACLHVIKEVAHRVDAAIHVAVATVRWYRAFQNPRNLKPSALPMTTSIEMWFTVSAVVHPLLNVWPRGTSGNWRIVLVMALTSCRVSTATQVLHF